MLDEWFLSPALNDLEELLFEGGLRVYDLHVPLPHLSPNLHRARFV